MATMSEDGGPPSKRTRLPKDEYDKMNREDLIQRLHELESYVEKLQAKLGDDKQDEAVGGREVEDRLKQQQVEATRRENVLVMRLTTKEQEMQEYLTQIQELKQVRNPGTTQLRGMMLDPAINLMFQRMKKEMDSCKEKLERAQNDLTAWKFSPDSQTGKRLMAKCRMLLQENEELGKVISAGRTAKLEGEIALEKKFVEEMKKSQAETDEFLVEMDEDMEGMQSTVYFLQQQLKEAKDEVARLRDKNLELQQQRDRFVQSLPGQGSPTASRSPAEANMDVDMEADSHSGVHLRTGTPEPQRTPSAQGAAHTNLSHSVTGNNVGNRTKSEAPGEGADSMVTSSAAEADHRPLQPSKPADVVPVTDSQLDLQPQQQQQYPQNSVLDDSQHLASTTNGEHMETDVSEEMPSSCDDDARTEQSNCHAPHGASEPKTLSPRPLSPHIPPTTAPVHSRAPYGPSSDGAYTYEGTDGSSEQWSPSNQSKTSGVVSDDEARQGTCGPDRPRTQGKGCGERLQNGIVTSTQFDTPPDTGMAE